MKKRTERVVAPACWRCDKEFYYDGPVSRYQRGVLMHPGDRFCLGGKRARKFRARDPKCKPPEWCPKRKSPCELRVYGFLDEESRQMQAFFSRLHGPEHTPSNDRYGVRFAGTTDWTPKQFWAICNEYGADLKLPVIIEPFEIVEIDDGFKSVCFYRNYEGFRLLRYFDTAEMRKRVSPPGEEAENAEKA